MKKLFIVSGLLLLVAGCRYKDGPQLSFRSVMDRITNTWVMHQCYQNGVDKTSDFNTLFPNYTLTIKDDKNYTITTTAMFSTNESGTWELNSDKTEINIKKDGTGTNKWKITKLMHTELWVEQTDKNGELIKYHLIPK